MQLEREVAAHSSYSCKSLLVFDRTKRKLTQVLKTYLESKKVSSQDYCYSS